MKLNKIRVGILSLCGVLALAGVGGAVAYIFNSATDSREITNESAVILSWGANTLGDVSNLTPSAPQFQSVTYEAAKSASVDSGFAKLSFTLAKGEATGDFDVYVGTTTFETPDMPAENTYKKLGTAEGGAKTCAYLVSLTEEPVTLYLKYVALGETELTYAGTLTVALTYETTGTAGWAA